MSVNTCLPWFLVRSDATSSGRNLIYKSQIIRNLYFITSYLHFVECWEKNKTKKCIEENCIVLMSYLTSAIIHSFKCSSHIFYCSGKGWLKIFLKNRFNVRHIKYGIFRRTGQSNRKTDSKVPLNVSQDNRQYISTIDY